MKKNMVIGLLTAFLITVCGAESALAQRYYGKHLCAYPGFKCVKVTRGATWEKWFHNQQERDLVKRLNRTNMALKYRSWILVPTNLSRLDVVNLSPFPSHRDTHGEKLVLVNLSQQAFGAYDASGELVYWGPISAGKGYCPDIGARCTTATGDFKIYRKQDEKCVSSKFPIETDGGAPMPYCMHYKGGFALHGSTLPGYHDSHGCVRLFVEDAKWLNQNFTTIGTRVIVMH